MTKTGETTQVRASATLESWAVRERPILFSAPMVRAILDGRKTVTRRIVKPQPELNSDYEPSRLDRFTHHPEYHWPSRQARSMVSLSEMTACCPYGAPGDRLWLRETWAPADAMAGTHDTDLDTPQCVAYAADRTAVVFGHDLKARKADTYAWNWDRLKWRPSIFMPRWASRITLEVTGVRVERLHEITEEDARAEGVVEGLIPADDYGPVRVGYVLGRDDGRCTLYPTARRAFEVGWDGINGKRAPWASNPWLWCISFRRVETP